MHSAKRHAAMYTIESHGRSLTLDELLPHWSLADRIGFVCDEPFGVLGAGLLLQAAVAAFYDARPARRDTAPQYPEIYCFHVGGRYGDHSMFDFTPPRKEVFVEGNPMALLNAVNDRAITRLAVPEAWVSLDADAPPMSGAWVWSERSAFAERVVGGFAYSADGTATGADVRITGDAQDVASDGDNTLNMHAFIETTAAEPAEEVAARMAGPATTAEYHAYLETATSRLGEVSPQQWAEAAARRRSMIRDGRESQSFRSLTTEQLLGALAVCGRVTVPAPQ